VPEVLAGGVGEHVHRRTGDPAGPLHPPLQQHVEPRLLVALVSEGLPGLDTELDAVLHVVPQRVVGDRSQQRDRAQRVDQPVGGRTHMEGGG
jgi:hypothetical protein